MYERIWEELENRDGDSEGCLPGPDKLGGGSGVVVITTGKSR